MTTPSKQLKQYGANVAWIREFQNSYNYGDLLLDLVAMATESSHKLIVKKWLNCIFSIISEVMWIIFGSNDHMMIVYSLYVFYDQFFFLFGCQSNINFIFFFKKEIFKWQFLQDHWSSITLIWYNCCSYKNNWK